MGRPRKRRTGRHRYGECSSADSSGACDDSFGIEAKSLSRRKCARYSCGSTSPRSHSGRHRTRSSCRSPSDPRDTNKHKSGEVHGIISSFAPDAVVLTQNLVDADQSDDSRLPSSADNKETPESPIGRTIRKRRSTPNRLVHFNDDSNDSIDASGSSFPDTRATAQGRLSPADKLSDSVDSRDSDITRRLRPRPPETMLRYSLSRPYRSSQRYSRERNVERHKKLALKERILRRPSGTGHRVTRFTNTELTTGEAAGSDEETRQGEECDNDGEQNGPDARRYPVRNRRHTDVYQVEYAHNNHGPTRNWLSGTGYENGRRRRRQKQGFHPGLHHCASDTSSSMDSNSDSSTQGQASYRHRKYSSWRRDPSANDVSLRVDEDEVRFSRRCNRSFLHARSELMPINIPRSEPSVKSTLTNRLLSGSSLADIEPMTLDESVGFEHVGGHDDHIIALKESIILPLMYPEIFSSFGIDPPRGVLFTGPPGTGKTLLARALANECTRMISSGTSHNASVSRRPIAFFMRKGADCLSKWVGESERQLRLLFDQAFRMRPSIIFFDEIDGLAPVRSSRQDQVHSSIVSTLLSLMDGLDQRAEVVIIGATNRPDSIDPALRRPGRFDREFTFGLPCEVVRQRILEVHTAKWNLKPSAELLQQLAHATSNFSGADLKALTTEACLSCLRRQYPQVYESRVKLALEKKYLVVSRADWIRALQVVRPSNDRSDLDVSTLSGLQPSACALAATKRTMLSPQLSPLLTSTVSRIVELFSIAFNPTSFASESRFVMDPVKLDSPASLSSVLFANPKLLLTGDIPDHVVSAVWHRLELVQVFTLTLANLVAFPSSMGMCPEAALAQILSAVKRSTLSPVQNLGPQIKKKATTGVVLFIPQIDILLRRLPHLTAVYLVDRLQCLMHDLVAETVHCALPLTDSSVGLSDLSQVVSQPARRLLLVATMNKGSTRSLPVRNCIPSSVPSSPPQRIPDIRVTTGNGVSITSSTPPTHGSAATRRSKENCSPIRLLHPIFGFHSSPPVQQQQTQKEEKLCNGISRAKRTSMGSGRNSIKSPDLNSSLTAVAIRSEADEQLGNRIATSVDIDLAFGATPRCLNDADDSLSDEVSLSEGSLDANMLSVPVSLHRTAEITQGMQIDQNPAATGLSASHKRSRSARLLSRLFAREGAVEFRVNSPSKSDRAAYFAPALIRWAQATRLMDSDKTCSSNTRPHSSRPPSPVPVPECADEFSADKRSLKLSREELVELERQEAQLFRRLRQVLRRVVAHLARHRRFAVFARPVQVDEAPDYYDVIKHPMDLGTIRDRIDADRYRNVDDFMKDVKLIYCNALEYNPANVPRSRDIRSRASEFWDEACLQLEEELDPPDLNERCKMIVEAQYARATEVLTNRTSSQSHRTNSAEQSDSVRSQSYERDRLKVDESPLSEIPVKMHPMPLGGRYSRRLHGQPPILEEEDVNLLEQINARRSTSIPQSQHTSSSSPRVRLGLNGSVIVDPELPVQDENASAELTADVTMVESNSSSQPETANFAAVTDVPPSPLSGLPPEPLSAHGSSDLPSDSPTIESTAVEPTEVDVRKLTAFHEMVVRDTDGWTVAQLVQLHAEFCAVLSTNQTKSHIQLIKDLEHVFNTSVKKNVAQES